MMTQELRLALETEANIMDQADALLEEYTKPALPGVYADTDTFYRVKWNRDKTRLYAQVIIPTSNGIRFGTYAKGAMSRLTRFDMLSVEQCETLSLAWRTCVMCGKGLTVTKSVIRGMGPVCAKRYGKA